MSSNKLERRSKIRKSIRKKISGDAQTPRIAVFRSNSAIYAQIIDDVKGHTLVSISSKEIGKGNANIELSAQVGKKLAEKALNAGITTAIFDRGGYKYHGRVKALAEGAREGGLKI